jgi:hypothetical protein
MPIIIDSTNKVKQFHKIQEKNKRMVHGQKRRKKYFWIDVKKWE